MLNGHDADIDVPEEVQNGDTNGAGIAGSERMSGVDLIDSRIKRKAKRVGLGLTRQLSKEAVLNGGNAIVQCTKILKNSRRPMNGHGRGLPKKGRHRDANPLIASSINLNDRKYLDLWLQSI